MCMQVGVEGWVLGADLVFWSKTNSADYHDEMNSEHFMEWFTEQLLPNIPHNSVIVIDNATYHNKQKDKPPTTANRKHEIQQWLDAHNIQYNDKDIKKTLLEKVQHVRQHRPTPIYESCTETWAYSATPSNCPLRAPPH